jgi:predicted RNA-binding Zn-ribbon protein involved in translation (DUF1610 family)
MPNEMNDILGEMGFDSSLNNMDSQLTIQEYRERLQVLLQPILDQRFPGNAPKRKILPHHDRITFACPYCGDSAQSDWAKRGNFILGGKFKNHFKCHNCGEFKRIDRFFKDYKTELKLDAINYMMDNLGDFTTFEGAKYDMSILLDMDHLDEYAIDRQELLRYFGLVEVKDSPVWSWLTNRMQYKTNKFLYSPNKNYILILNLTPGGKILGAQKRKFSGHNRFETYKLSKLYEAMKKPLETNEEQTDYLDTLSMIFNICLINFNKPITLFEGPMDAFLFKNSIANTGANKELPIDVPVRYWYDSDETGKRKAMQHIEKGEEVFLWDKFIRDLDLPYKNKWDWNDAVMWIKKNNVTAPLIDLYFSGDPLDAIDI